MAIWIGEVAFAWAAVFAVQIPLRKKSHRLLRTVVFFAKIALAIFTGALFITVDAAPGYVLGDVLCAVYIALIGDIFASAIEYAARRIRAATTPRAEQPRCMQGIIAVLSLLICIAVAAYGISNALAVNQRTHTWEVDGLTEEHTFAFIADVHAGSAQPLDVFRDVCAQVNKAKPEFVVLGGDITDERTSLDDMIATYEIVSEIDAPVYFVYGNHDRQPNFGFLGGRTYSDEQLEEAIAGAGARTLSDEFVQISDDLVLLGREDMSAGPARKPWSNLYNPYEGKGALVVADHQPYDFEQLAEEESSLQVSGHTHAGQLWPFQAIYRMLGLPAYGEFEYPGTRLYVSAGESGWAMPLRTEEHCEWDLITLRPSCTPLPSRSARE